LQRLRIKEPQFDGVEKDDLTAVVATYRYDRIDGAPLSEERIVGELL